MKSNNFFPLIDVQEAHTKYIVHADLPGVDGESINMNFNDNILTITGEKINDVEAMEAGAISVEREYGSFKRDIIFKEEIDQENIKAKLKGGVLSIELMKNSKNKNPIQKIPILSQREQEYSL
jgi:HSP20 family protein